MMCRMLSVVLFGMVSFSPLLMANDVLPTSALPPPLPTDAHAESKNEEEKKIEPAGRVIAKIQAKDFAAPATLYVYSKEALKEVQIGYSSAWFPLTPVRCEDPTYFAYKSAPTKFIDGGSVAVRAYLPDGSQFVDTLAYTSAEDSITVAVTPKLLISAAELRRRQIAAWYGAQDPVSGRFMILLNQHRVRHGRRVVYFDQNLSNWAHANNNAGGGHSVMAGSRQNWTDVSDPDGAFHMWLNSGGHNANMLFEGASIAGIGISGGHATLNLR